MTGTDDSGDESQDDGTDLPLLIGLVFVGFVVIFGAVSGLLILADTYIFGVENQPIERPQAGFEFELGEEVRLVHAGGDELNSSRVIVSRTGVRNSTWTGLAGWSEGRKISHGDSVPLPGAERGDEISVVVVYEGDRTLLFRGRVQPSSSTTGTPRFATSSANAPESASSASKVL